MTKLLILIAVAASAVAAQAAPMPAKCSPKANSCSAAAPACGKTTTGKDSCGVACSKKGPDCPPAAKCVAKADSCAAAPACGQTAAGKDSCGNACTKAGPACTCKAGGKTYNADYNCMFYVGKGDGSKNMAGYKVTCTKTGAWKKDYSGSCQFNSFIKGPPTCVNTCVSELWKL